MVGSFELSTGRRTPDISDSIGGTILSNGQIVKGCRGRAGRFAHMCLDLAGPPCACGRKGCWETLVSMEALLRMYAELAPASQAVTPKGPLRLAINNDLATNAALSRYAVLCSKRFACGYPNARTRSD